MQTETVAQAGGVLVVVGGMALVVLAIFQYLLTQIKNSDKTRDEMFDELAEEKLEAVRLKGQIILYEAKYTQMKNYAQRYYKAYKQYENLYNKTLEKTVTTTETKVTETKTPLDKTDNKV